MLTQVLDTDSHKVNRKLVVVNSELCKCTLVYSGRWCFAFLNTIWTKDIAQRLKPMPWHSVNLGGKELDKLICCNGGILLQSQSLKSVSFVE